MKTRLLFLFLFLATTPQLFAEEPLLVSGPMLGYAEHRSVLIWCEVSQDVRTATIRYWEKDNTDFYYEMDYQGTLGKPYNPIRFELVKLKMNTQYQYEIVLNGKSALGKSPLFFNTKDLWEWRKPAPDFSFVTGSCAYINDLTYDRPGEPYGQDPAIFKAMTFTKADFNLWLGDNLYFREADYSSVAGMQYRYSYQRRVPEMAELLAKRPNYAIWDDHDYGPNDANQTFELRNESMQLFKNYWGNKSYGEANNDGIYSKFSWSDCDFFLTDDRSHRSPNGLKDSIAGKPNCEKDFFGYAQLTWLKNSLLTSNATFKFVCVGSQVLNPMNGNECVRNFPCEYNDLLSFIVTYKIPGVVFLSGDRHFSEVISFQPKGGYKLYDITASPFSSKAYDLSQSPELKNPSRVDGTLVMDNNYDLITVSGPKGERKLKMMTLNKMGASTANFEISEQDLTIK